MAKSSSLLPDGYSLFLSDLKDRIRTAQLRAAIAVNRELVISVLANWGNDFGTPTGVRLGGKGH